MTWIVGGGGGGTHNKVCRVGSLWSLNLHKQEIKSVLSGVNN